MTKIISIFGTRPEAIKMAPLALALATQPGIDSQICLTAQHREMLDGVLAEFNLTANHDLNIMQPGQTLYSITTKALNGLGHILEQVKPDLVLVHGDTTTTFAGALAAFYNKIPVGHVEAGLRSGDIYSPYPEEMNRKLVTQIAALHFAPTARNAAQLTQDGVTDGIFVTGNTVIDAMAYTLNRFPGKFGNVIDEIDAQTRRIITLTCHRRENYGAPMAQIFRAAREIVERHTDVELIYPVHPSPVVQETTQEILGGRERIHLIAPLDTVQMHALLSRSYLVMTDSGGLQEEAPALGVPVLVLRRETERPEAIEAGTVRLIGVEQDEITAQANRLLTDKTAYAAMANAVNPYGDGKAAQRITDAILWHFGHKPHRPLSFAP